LAFIRTSEWNAHDVQVRQKAADGTVQRLAHDDAGGISRDLSIKGIHVRKGGASLHKLAEYSLRPNTCVVLETKEHITTGSQVIGFICSRASLASKGLIVSNLKIDPNYSDTLYITVFNAGTGNIDLDAGYPFCAVVFCRTDGPATLETRRPDPEGISEPCLDKVLRLYPYFLTGLVSVGISILGSVIARLMMK
jgi:deoxycytidine triphosphate deaminase